MSNRAGKDFALLLVGLGMLGCGLVLFFRSINIYTVQYMFWGMGGSNIGVGNLGILFVPFILGLVLWVMYPRSMWPKILVCVSLLALIVSIISTIRFGFKNRDMLELLMYIILIFVGGALSMKVLIIDDPKRKNKSDKEN